MKIKIPTSVTRVISKTAFTAKKVAPTAMVVAAAGTSIAAVIFAVKQKPKADIIKEEMKKSLSNAEDCLNDCKKEEYSEKDYKSDLTKIYIRSGFQFLKVYSVPIILEIGSIALMAGSHGLMLKRNATLTAACSALGASLKEYRKNVADILGDEVEKNLFNGIKCEEVETIDAETGETKTRTDFVYGKSPSMWARVFDESSKEWTKDPEYNKQFLMRAQRMLTDKLEAEGYLFLNDVYDFLGFDKTQLGQVVGWLSKSRIEDFQDYDGDGYIDFGIFDIFNERKCAFVNGYERSIFLDFNCDGVIIDKI